MAITNSPSLGSQKQTNKKGCCENKWFETIVFVKEILKNNVWWGDAVRQGENQFWSRRVGSDIVDYLP